MIERINEARKKGEGGFTLIELLVVIVILAILSAVVVFATRGAGDKGKSAAYSQDAKTIRTAEEAYCAKFGSYADADTLVQERFLSEPPTYHTVSPTTGGTCGNPAGAASGFSMTCDASKPGCGSGGATPTGGTLVTATSTATGNGNSLNPAVTSQGGIHANSEYMFNGLAAWSASDTVTPDLATWTISPDNKTVNFTIRQGVKWHDHTATVPHYVTANDVKWAYENALLRFHGRTLTSMGAALSMDQTNTDPYLWTFTGAGGAGITTTAPTGTTGGGIATFTFAYPYLPLFKQANVTEGAIIPESVYSPCFTAKTLNGTGCAPNNPANGSPTAGAVPVGSGAFKFEGRDATQIRLVANPFFKEWKPGLPYLARLTEQFITTTGAPNAHLDALKAGTVDWIADIPASQFANVQATRPDIASLQVNRFTGGSKCISTVPFNLTAPGDMTAPTPSVAGDQTTDHPILGGLGDGVPAGEPVADGYRVRKAIALAINRQLGFQQVQGSAGAVATAPIHSGTFGYATGLTMPAYNPADPTGSLDAAKAELAAAGWREPLGTDPGGTADTRRVAQGVTNVADGTRLALFFDHESGSGSLWGDRILSDLAAVGIGITKRQAASSSAFTNRIFGNSAVTDATERVWDLTFVSYCNGDEPQIGVRRQYYSSQVTQASFTNASGYKDANMDTLWNEAARAPDSATAAAKYQSIQQQAINHLPYWWLVETINIRGTRTRCSGFNHLNTGLFAEAVSCRSA